MGFQKYATFTTSILLLFALVILVSGLALWQSNLYTGLIYLIISGIQVISLVLLYPRVQSAGEDQEKGNRVVIHNWSVLSVGIAGVALFQAPFFRVDTSPLPVVAFILSVAIVLVSALNIYMAVKKVKARMII
jgi:hypothetical protein